MNQFIGRAVTGRLRAEQVEAEAIAQIRKLQEAGIAVSHLDSHKHTHMFGAVLRPLVRAATACGVRAMRNPFEPVRLSSLAARPAMKRWLEVMALNWLSAGFSSVTREAGLATPDGTIGIAATGNLDERLFRSLVEFLPEGTWELVCHPGYNDDDLQRAGTRLRQSRADELKLLTSASVRGILDKYGISLITYRDL